MLISAKTQQLAIVSVIDIHFTFQRCSMSWTHLLATNALWDGSKTSGDRIQS